MLRKFSFFLWENFKTGFITILGIVIVFFVINAIVNFILLPIEFITENIFYQGAIGAALVLLVGLVVRIIKTSKRAWILGFMPTASLENQEVLWESSPGSGIYESGIFMKIVSLEIHGEKIRMARVMKATGGPTSVGGISEIYVPIHKLIYLNSSGKDVFKRLVTLGVGGNGNQN